MSAPIRKVSLVYWSDTGGKHYLIMREFCPMTDVCACLFQRIVLEKTTIAIFDNSFRFVILSYLLRKIHMIIHVIKCLFIYKREVLLNLAMFDCIYHRFLLIIVSRYFSFDYWYNICMPAVVSINNCFYNY